MQLLVFFGGFPQATFFSSAWYVFRKQRRCVPREWQDICVGDIIHLSCNEVIPADVILLRSSDKQGICHIDTSNVDGENNLKQRNVIAGLHQQVCRLRVTGGIYYNSP